MDDDYVDSDVPDYDDDGENLNWRGETPLEEAERMRNMKGDGKGFTPPYGKGNDKKGGRTPADHNLENIPEVTAVDADSSTIGAAWYDNGKVYDNSKGKGKSYEGYVQKPSYKSWIYSGDKDTVSSDFAGDGPIVPEAVREVPDIPSKADVESHNLTYSPYAAWCEMYQMSAGGEYVVDGVGSRATMHMLVKVDLGDVDMTQAVNKDDDQFVSRFLNKLREEKITLRHDNESGVTLNL